MNPRLANSASSYLKSAAHQPVDWHPWGPDALARAQAEQKPILLDIGAVWCHWCHVMDGESYDDPTIAEQLNRDWICIKVDRDERPDVDARYQRAVQALTGQGGWPLTAFLTPTGDVFYGGTYFPAAEGYGRPSFAKVLTELAAAFHRHPDRIAAQAQEIREYIAAHGAEAKAGPVTAEALAKAADAMARVFDFRNGGFGSQPKFPHPAACDFLLARWFDTRVDWMREMVEKTLTAMARGGIYDQLGGGFHRYSVDARWIVPHFEKMSYDNSELLKAYVHAVASEGGREKGEGSETVSSEYRRVITGIVDWVSGVMSDPAGGYYASQDADVGIHDDGDYFTWTPDEARAALSPDEWAVLERYYDIADAGEMHHDPRKNVLWIRESVADIAQALGLNENAVRALLEAGRAKLKASRDARQAPFIDTTLYTAWNAMMASAMLDATALIERPDIEEHALRTLERLFVDAADGDGAGGVRHAIGGTVDGILDDQVNLAATALDALEATGDRRWLDRALNLMRHVWDTYRAPSGGLLDTAPRPGAGYLDQPIVPVHDQPTPSPNGVAALVLARLAEHTGDASWRTRRDELLSALAGDAADMSLHGATLLRAMDWALNPAAHVVLVGHADDAVTQALHRAARATFRPRKVITRLQPGASPAGLPAPLAAALDGKAPRAYVCAGPQCAPPVETPDALAHTLVTFGIAAK